MIGDKNQLLEEARALIKIDQFDQSKMNPSLTKLGPCIQQSNKFSFSSQHPLQSMPETYTEQMAELSQKYQRLRWLPLALPKVELNDFEEFKRIWDKESINIRPANDLLYPVEFRGLHITANSVLDFNLHELYVDGKLSKTQISDAAGYYRGRSVSAWTKKLYKHKFFFNMISQIMDTFPINQLSNMIILEVVNDVKPHREQSWAWRCPTEFHISLHDENDVSTMYVSDIQRGDSYYIDMPSDTNSVCWSNGTQLYGIDYHGKPNYQLVVNAVWSPKKLDQLMEDSINKYKHNLNYIIG